MRTSSGRTLLSLAFVALIGGPAYSGLVAPRLARLPVDVRDRQVAEGTGVYLDTDAGFRLVGPVRLRSVHDVRGVPASGSSTVAVWVAHDRFLDLDRHRTLDASTERYALDRRTARSVACCGADPNSAGALAQAFPVGTKRTSYPWWDPSAGRAFVARFVGVEAVRGVELYRFRVSASPTIIDRIELPPEALDRSGSEPVRLTWWYRSTTDLWVEPATGIIVKGAQRADQWLANRAGARRLTVATTDLVDTPGTVDGHLRLADERRSALFARSTWPWLVGPMVALVLIAVAAIRSVLPARTSARRSDARRPQPGGGSRPVRATAPASR